jgi:hypothetical protein
MGPSKTPFAAGIRGFAPHRLGPSGKQHPTLPDALGTHRWSSRPTESSCSLGSQSGSNELYASFAGSMSTLTTLKVAPLGGHASPLNWGLPVWIRNPGQEHWAPIDTGLGAPEGFAWTCSPSRVARRVERRRVPAQAHELKPAAARSGACRPEPQATSEHTAARGEQVGVVELPGRGRLARARSAREGAREVHGAEASGRARRGQPSGL